MSRLCTIILTKNEEKDIEYGMLVENEGKNIFEVYLQI